MDKEFKKIFDGLRKAADMTEKIKSAMDKYQDHLDEMVGGGLMTEHEARMDFFSKTMEVVNSAKAEMMEDDDDDEGDDDDAEDEQCDCDDECTEEDCDADKDEAIKEAFKLVNAIWAARHNGCDVTRIDYAVRRKHRG